MGYYSFTAPEGRKAELGVGRWPIADSLPTVVACQPPIGHSSGKVCKSKTDVQTTELQRQPTTTSTTMTMIIRRFCNLLWLSNGVRGQSDRVDELHRRRIPSTCNNWRLRRLHHQRMAILQGEKHLRRHRLATHRYRRGVAVHRAGREIRWCRNGRQRRVIWRWEIRQCRNRPVIVSSASVIIVIIQYDDVWAFFICITTGLLTICVE